MVAITILATTMRIGTMRAITMAGTTTTETATVGGTIVGKWLGTDGMAEALHGTDHEAAALLWFVGVELATTTVAGSTGIIKTNQDKKHMKKALLIMTALVGLIIASYATPPVEITALPFNITAPGTHTLSSNLTAHADVVPEGFRQWHQNSNWVGNC